MVNCAYCDSKIDRLVFCNASHKTMYHRKHSKKSVKANVIQRATKPDKLKPVPKELNTDDIPTIKEQKKKPNPFSTPFTLCTKHRVMKITCKCK